MQRTEFFANQSRSKLIDYDENESYTDWKNEKQWEIVKNKKIEPETKKFTVEIRNEPIYKKRTKKKRILGIPIKKTTYNEVVGERKITTYEIRRRNKITDFDENISYIDWVVIKRYTEVK